MGPRSESVWWNHRRDLKVPLSAFFPFYPKLIMTSELGKPYDANVQNHILPSGVPS